MRVPVLFSLGEALTACVFIAWSIRVALLDAVVGFVLRELSQSDHWV